MAIKTLIFFAQKCQIEYLLKYIYIDIELTLNVSEPNYNIQHAKE